MVLVHDCGVVLRYQRASGAAHSTLMMRVMLSPLSRIRPVAMIEVDQRDVTSSDALDWIGLNWRGRSHTKLLARVGLDIELACVIQHQVHVLVEALRVHIATTHVS